MPSPTLHARQSPLADPASQLAALHYLPLSKEFDQSLTQSGLTELRPSIIQVLQLNVGKVCNQTCRHCHVDAGPDRRERMSKEVMEICLKALESSSIPAVDITGGAPELHPDFRWLVEQCRALGRHVMDRCNLTVLTLPVGEGLPDFFSRHQVEVVCSLPHYRQGPTDRQRGDGVFEKSLEGLRRLNEAGYGQEGTGLRLVLVTNPVGAFLSGVQPSLEKEWKREMERLHGIRFDALYCVNNMPISRYLEWLMDSGNLESYMERLVTTFNPAAVDGLMCRTTLSVGWDGTLYDCDFNQMLEMPVLDPAPRHIKDFNLTTLAARRIATDRHCFGCTAGAGSSCGGAIAS